MNKTEAIQVALKNRDDVYLLANRIFDITKPYHRGNQKEFFELCEAIVQEGIDIVDDCVEDMYRVICNIDKSGKSLDDRDEETLIATVTGWVREKVIPREGLLMKSGCIFGILHSQKKLGA